VAPLIMLKNIVNPQTQNNLKTNFPYFVVI
jgi:hypothetical protein